MQRATPLSQHRQLILRIAGLWMVVLALGVAVIGIILALHQARSFTMRLMAQAEALAARVASDARTQLDREMEAAFAAASWQMDGEAGSLSASLPRWIEGLYVTDGTSVYALGGAPATAEVEPLIRQTHLAHVGPQLHPPVDELGYTMHSLDGRRAALASMTVSGAEGVSVTKVALLNLAHLRSDFLEPLVPVSAGLGLVNASEARGRWWQPLSGPMRLWAIQPTEEFVREQRQAVIGQTIVYIGLSVLSLAALLLAMWFLARLARREVALAEMKANFVADVSHELKTPLALIRMFGETLQSGRVADEEKRHEYYGIITRESTRLTNLINNILDFARIEAGGKQYTFAPTDVGAVVRETFEAYRPQLEHQGFSHHLTVQPELPAVEADRDAVSQAVLNLLGNAIKYSDDEKYVAIEVARDTRRGRHGVLISVHDHGIGIKPEDRAHLVEGFFRSSDGRVRQRGGTGLGLALVKHIVEAHHGTLDAEARLVKGSTFRIFLPAAGGVEGPTRKGSEPG